MRPSRSIISGALLLAAIISVFAIRDDDTVDVFIDNADSVAITVAVNGDDPVRVPPGSRKTINCRPGRTLFAISRDSSVPRFEAHFLRPSDDSGERRTYLLNPDRRRFFVTANVEYGNGDQQRILSLAINNSLLTEQQRRALLYQHLRKRCRMLPMTGWHDITGTEYRFQSPPAELMTSGTRECIKTLQCVPRDVYCNFIGASGKRKPQTTDCQRLALAAKAAFARF